MEVTPTFIAHPCELELLDFLRRRLRDGEVVPWIHAANVYGCDPVAISAQFAPATAANGKPGWYFVCTPQQKQPKDRRIKRTAGPGTWKEERGWPLVSINGGGVHEKVGWKRKFSYLIKAEDNDTRLGWIMLEIKLADGTATCLCKIYRSPRIRHDQLSKALNLSLEAPPMAPSSSGATLGPATQMASGPIHVHTAAAAAFTATTSGLSQIPDAGSPTAAPNVLSFTSAPTLAGPKDVSPAAAAAVTAITSGLSSIPDAASPTAAPDVLSFTSAPSLAGPMDVPPAAAAAAVTAITSGLSSIPYAASPTAASDVLSFTSGPMDVPPAAAAAVTAITLETSPSPPRRWVHVQISDSPTRASDKSLARPKRVYSMMLPAEEGFSSSAKKPKPVDCKGWLTIEPVHGTDSPIV